MVQNKLVSFFADNGYAVIENFFSVAEIVVIEKFMENWINKNISNAQNTYQSKNFLNINHFSNYHEFIIKNNIDHLKIAKAKYRYIDPPEKIKKLIYKDSLFKYLKSFSSFNSYKRWQDPGFGLLGYRLIRPNSNDGYPPSCKNWGAANNLYSVWIPISGCNHKSNIRFLPKSHKKEFKKYLPKNSKFTKGEYRLNEDIPLNEFIRPKVNKNGIIIFHPACIHSEDSSDTKNTRLNLEYRFKLFNES